MNTTKRIISILVAIFTIIIGVSLYHGPSYAEDFSIPLKQGKNLISIPLIPQDTSISQVFQSIDGLYADVWGADPLDTSDPWKHYNPNYIPYSDLTTVQYGKGYYVFVSQDCVLALTGNLPQQNYILNLNQGWNLIGWPFLYSQPISEALSDLQFGIDYNQVSRINPGTKAQEDYYNTPATDAFDTFDPGKGYYIYCLQSKTATLLLLPQIKITSHQDNSYVSTPTVDISGTIDDDSTAVLVNGITAAVSQSIFTASIGPLSEGPNTITAQATNTAGNIASDSITLNLDSQPPIVQITDPLDGATINTAPITVSGTISEPADILVNDVLATVNGTAFTAAGVDLRLGENTITATAYDIAGNTSTHTITVTSTVTSDYSITKLTSDVYEYDPTNIIAGSQVSLGVRVEVDGAKAVNEPVEFLITQGNGSMIQSVIDTDVNGEATGLLNTDTDASATNLVEVFDQNFPSEKVIFHIDTKEGPPANLVKLTDDSIDPVPGAAIDLAVRLEDSNGNQIPDEEITYQITSGPGLLSATSDNTSVYGNAKVILTTTTLPNTLCTVQAQATSNPTLTVIFNITTSNAPTVTADDVIAKVTANDQLIQDVMADITVTSNAPWLAPTTQLKLWEKGDKQKIQELSPEPGIHIRPPTETSGTTVNMTREILTYNPATDIYVIKSVEEGQIEEYPYEIDHIDYAKGVIVKGERYLKEGENISSFLREYSNFINIGGIWGFQTMTEAMYDGFGNQIYNTTYLYSNITYNTGIPDSEFE